MNRRTKSKFFFTICVTLFLTFSIINVCVAFNNHAKVVETPPLRNDVDSASYFLGYFYGINFHNWDFEDVNVEAFASGMAEAVKKGKDYDQELMMLWSGFMDIFSQKLQDRVLAKTLKEGLDFLEANKQKPGIITLPSGLQYRIIENGAGSNPASDDNVELHYHGSLIDGEVFDSSIERGEPIELNVGQVIAGFSEALKLMRPGDVWEIFIPSELGYGEYGSPPNIKPNAVLIFKINLIRIIPDDEE